MTQTFTLNQPLQSIFLAGKPGMLRNVLLMMVGVMVLAASAQLAIPFQPVPLTFQSVTVVLIGLAYGSRLGLSTVAAYLIAGVCGAPVFAHLYAGPIVFMGATGGYLLGFLPAVALCGYLAGNGWGKHFLGALMAGLLATIIILFCGAVGLATLTNWHTAWAVGVKPFLLTEPLKLVLMAGIAKHFWK